MSTLRPAPLLNTRAGSMHSPMAGSPTAGGRSRGAGSPTPMSPEEVDDADLRNAFGIFDFSDTGVIHADDLPFVLKGLGLGSDVLSKEDVKAMQRAMDPSHRGRIPYDTFKRVLAHTHRGAASYEGQWKAFRLFDRDKKGYVTSTDLQRVALDECNGVLSVAQCDFIVEQLSGASGRPRRGSSPASSPRGSPRASAVFNAPAGLGFEDWKYAVGKTHNTNSPSPARKQ